MCRLAVQCLSLLFSFLDLGCMLVNWSRLLILLLGGTAKHCVDQCIVLFRYCLVGGDTAIPGGLHAMLCHAFLVFIYLFIYLFNSWKTQT